MLLGERELNGLNRLARRSKSTRRHSMVTGKASRKVTGIVETDFRHDLFHAKERRLNQHSRLVHPKHLEVAPRRHAGFNTKEERETRRG